MFSAAATAAEVRRLFFVRTAFVFAAALIALMLADQFVGLSIVFTVVLIIFLLSVSAAIFFQRKARRYSEASGICELELHRMLGMFTQQEPPTIEGGNKPIDNLFADDLMLRGSRSLLHLVDSTHTPEGRSTLEAWIFNPDLSESAYRQRRSVIFGFEKYPETRLRILLAAQSIGGAGTLITTPKAFRRSLFWRHSVLCCANWVSILLLILASTSTPLVLSLFLSILFLTSVLHSPNRKGVLHFDQYSDLGKIYKIASDRKIRKYSPLKPYLDTITNRDTGIGAFRKRLFKIEVLGTFEQTIIPRFAINLFFPYTEIMSVLQYRLSADMQAHSKCWSAAWGIIEAAIALSVFGRRADFSIPRVIKGGPLSIYNFANPLLLSQGLGVRNSIELKPGEVLCLTGPNMSGKSTFLRSVGINVVLAHAGSSVMAAEAKVPLVSIVSSISVNDDLHNGISRFGSEIKRLKAFSSRASEGVLFLSDEILSSTNASDRKSAVEKFVDLVKTTPSFFLFSTHDESLSEYLECKSNVHQAHMDSLLDESGMHFTYSAKPGRTTNRNAMYLLEKLEIL
ncbi:MAG: hypothetical protein NXH97_12490 [Rhodobacteraceae bacterium]|nr:hypothetical protein [Paracoccaceae bacterium]